MSLDKKIRKNLDGEYIIIYANQLSEGIAYAQQLQISQIQLRGFLEQTDAKVDFSELQKISNSLEIISLETLENVINTDGFYSLKNLKKIYLDKQKFKIDISKFPELEHLGGEYWKGLINVNRAISLQSLVLSKFSGLNLNELSELKKLQRLHIYSSKIETLEGIEQLPLIGLSLVRNNALENIEAIHKLHKLKDLLIEKCKKISDYTFVDRLKEKIDVRVII
ncbi:hypothetical protein [Apibacter adventoris]|uniref:hypothetical protein n=1 Tax=Apibacter adventoris TaxID=1679466 RepID=UPI000CF67286|nr:hypothetical protein [Apibacter adventoris]PQL93814.1 hypothetical protein C4S76_06925 [Apibacter adventoris]